MNFKVGDIISATGAKSFGIGSEVIIKNISTDSRTIEKDSLFIALSGENFDGKDYAKAALEKGALAVMVEDSQGLPAEKILLVKNTRLALLEIAGSHRRSLKIKVVGVTGSVGKTTTKEMIACVLSAQGKTFKTKRNLNNEIGLSQMLLELDDSFDFAVLELGVDGFGQMLPMTNAASPNVAAVTNIGSSHLKAFKTQENIKIEKMTIAQGLSESGVLVLNGDDEFLRTEKGLFYGVDWDGADFKADNIGYSDSSSGFELRHDNKTYDVNIPVFGKHNVLNALCAIAVGKSLGVPIKTAIDALKSYETEGMRQRVVETNGYTVVEDCYNASPQSMKAAIETLALMTPKKKGRRIAVFSDMLELGAKEVEYHREVGRLIAKNRIDLLFATGRLSKHMIDSLAEAGYNNGSYFESKAQLVEALKQELHSGDIAWVKASRGMKLEEVLEALY